MSTCIRTLAALVVASSVHLARAEDAYYIVPLDQLTLVEGELRTDLDLQSWKSREAMMPRAVLEGDGEAYVGIDQTVLAVRADGGRQVVGRLFVPNVDWDGVNVLKFAIAPDRVDEDARATFHRIRAQHFKSLIDRDVPGRAWFGHQYRQSQLVVSESVSESSCSAPDVSERAECGCAHLDGPPSDEPVRFGQRDDTDEFLNSFALLDTNRAMSERLQLDRLPTTTAPDEKTIAIDSLPGLTPDAIDWQPLIDRLDPKPDPLASKVPADQHVVFFPSLASVVKRLDDARRQGKPISPLMTFRSEDPRLLDRYRRQMCLPRDAADRQRGLQVIQSAALTGSDLCYEVGTDVAILYESTRPTALHVALLARIEATASTADDAKLLDGKLGEVSYHAVRTPDRRLSAYLAQLDDVVVITNSLVQLEKLVDVLEGRTESIASLDEYTFFRDRYPLGDPEEADPEATGLFFLSEATMRRWWGPRWRIGSSRRVRDLAVIARAQAVQMDAIARRTVSAGPIETELPITGSGELTLDERGVSSNTHGSFAFMTPIVELLIDRVTEAEKEGYLRWHERSRGMDGTWAHGPIALRLGVGQTERTADLTVMRLTKGVEETGLASISAGARFPSDAADPHEALYHLVCAINTDSESFRTYANFLPVGIREVSLGWLGQWVSLYADDDPVWREVGATDLLEQNQIALENVHRLPIALEVEVTNSLKLAAFLVSLRVVIDQMAPEQIVWDSLSYKEKAYVRIRLTEEAKRASPEMLDKLALYYVYLGESLLVTPSKDLLRRAIDRRLARGKSAQRRGNSVDARQPTMSWLGSNLAVRIDGNKLRELLDLQGEGLQESMQDMAWDNLPILNEWKRLYPDQDPLDLHERIWHARLICPGGGQYAWNETYQTMESTTYGHPAAPKAGPSMPPSIETFTRANIGLTFEQHGLRVRVAIE